MERKMEWNETEILVWITENARIEWNGRCQEWKTIFRGQSSKPLGDFCNFGLMPLNHINFAVVQSHLKELHF